MVHTGKNREMQQAEVVIERNRSTKIGADLLN